jgi:hypothetical protein
MNNRSSKGEGGQHPDEQRRDHLLKRLLKTPPQPRPKRDRKKDAEATEDEGQPPAAPHRQVRKSGDNTD